MADTDQTDEDANLRRMLAMKPKPHKPLGGKRPKSRDPLGMKRIVETKPTKGTKFK